MIVFVMVVITILFFIKIGMAGKKTKNLKILIVRSIT